MSYPRPIHIAYIALKVAGLKISQTGKAPLPVIWGLESYADRLVHMPAQRYVYPGCSAEIVYAPALPVLELPNGI